MRHAISIDDLVWSDDTLERYEKHFSLYFRSGIRIIGEIPITQNDIQELSKSIRLNITDRGFAGSTRNLVENYPLIFLTLMAGFAAYNNQQNYWQAFGDLIGQERQNFFNQGWHRSFVSLAKKHNLKVFDFSDDNQPYVMSIRYQGGIPAYSLPDYFEKMVLPAIKRESLREVPPKQALAYLLTHTYFVDSPVFDFLENSGDLGVDFFTKSCALASHALKTHGEILSADEVDLPSSVVEAFEHWWEHREDALQHWSKPYLQAAPYSEDTAVFLNLPQQEITLDLFASSLFWQISYPAQGEVIQRNCRVSRSSHSVVTQKDYLPIPEPMERIEISLNALSETGNKVELRRWNISLIPPVGKTPLVAFTSSYDQISSARQLPAEIIYLLTPLNSTLTFDGEGRQVEECVPLVGAWQDWQMHLWDLRETWSLEVTREDEPLGDVIPVQGVIAQPELVDGHLFQFQDLEDPLYTSEIPSLRVPLGPGETAKARLSSWQVHIHSLWNANPCIDKIFHLDDHASKVEIKDDRGIFPLKHVLGDAPVGIYEIHVRGPRGLGGEFRIRLWPKLMVIGHSMQLIKPVENPKPSIFIIRLQDGASCEVQPGTEEVEIRQTPGGWQVTAPPDLNRVLLNLVSSAEGGGQVRIPISIPLPKLRWGLATEKDQGTLTWGQSVLHRSIDQLQQSGNSSLHMEMYGLGKLNPELKLRLVEMSDKDTMVMEAPLIHTDFTKDWLRVTLGQFMGTIQHISSLARFELVYTPRVADSEEVCIPLLELSRALDIQDPKLEPVTETTWRLTWQEDRPLKNRRVMIQAPWQPWQKPWEYKIPNKARGEFVIEDIALPLSRYQLFFYVLADYEAPLKEPPMGIAPFIIDQCTPPERMEKLPKDCPTHNEKFRNLVELAIIHDSLSEGDQRDILFSEAAKSLIHLTNLDLLIGTLKWMQNKEVDKAVKSFFFLAMFNILIIGNMLRTYKLSDPSMLEYLSFTGSAKNIPADSAKLLLKRVDDPIAISSSLRSLLNRKDKELLSIIINMMAEARLSKRDALELLSGDILWSFEELRKLEQNQFTDSLLAVMLPVIAQKINIQEDPSITDLLARVFSYEDDEQLLRVYLQHFFASGYPLRFDLLIDSFKKQQVTEEDAMELLSKDPKAAIESLEKLTDDNDAKSWVIKLVELFPEAAGVIMAGSMLKTPFGIATVDTIQKWNQGHVTRSRFGEVDYCLNVVIGDGGSRLRITIDYHEMKLNIPGTQRVWKCSLCDFMHADQNKVSRHASQTHNHVALSSVSLPVTFLPEDIEVIIKAH